jgi:molybdate transport system substrate-binding protein
MKTLFCLALFLSNLSSTLGSTLWPAVAQAAEKNPLRVLAAASLVDALPRASAGWNAAHPDTPVEAVFEGSSKLARQIENGAPADVFISADLEWMDYLAKLHKIDDSSRANLVSNEIVWIVPASATKTPKAAAEIPALHYKKIALAGENVPISRYAQAALEKLGVWTQVEKSVVRGENVRTDLMWVGSGAADAGVVYRSDALGDDKVKVAFEFPSSSHAPVVYPIAVTSGSHAAKTARDFVAYLKSADAQASFKKSGFKAAE